MFSVNFCNGCIINIDCPDKKRYKIVVYDQDVVIFEQVSSSGIFKLQDFTPTLNYSFVNYKIKIFHEDELVYQEQINLSGQKVKINFDSNALGDNIAWIAQVDKFQKLHKCELYVNCKYKELFEKVYPNLNFTDSQRVSTDKQTIIPMMESFSCKNFFCFYEPCHCYYASFDLGFYALLPSLRNVTLSKIASNLLGMKYEEIVPDIFVKNKERVHQKRYVCIAVQSTAQYKYWNNTYGWQQVVDYLIDLGYDVLCIDKNDNYGFDGFINSAPKNIVNKTGDFPLQERITDLLHCDFFIGLGSGLSWLAWALKKPVILISGFSNPNSEFYTPYRVHNPNVCNSCWNDESVSPHSKHGWHYCPRNKNYECSSNITSDMVIEMIERCISDLTIKINT